MPLDQSMLNSVVRISSAGELLGSGSIVSVPSETIRGKRWPYLVTAHHVIRGQIEIEVEIPNPVALGDLYEPQPARHWRQPFDGVDLAVAPFFGRGDRRWEASRLDLDVLAPDLPPSLGAPVHYLAIFAPVGRPIARSGAVGALHVPIEGQGYRYEGHLVDCRSYAGFSGSPCFATQPVAMLDDLTSQPPEVPSRGESADAELASFGHCALMVGLFTAHYTDEDAVEHEHDRAGGHGVGVMLGARYVWEALMAEDARAERREWDEMHQAERKAVRRPMVEAAAHARNAEFERFEALTRQFATPPKPQAS